VHHAVGSDPDASHCLEVDLLALCEQPLESNFFDSGDCCHDCGSAFLGGVLLLDFYPARRRAAVAAVPPQLLCGFLSSRALVSSSAVIGEGTIVLANALVGTRTSIGAFCKIGIGAQIHHDAILEDFVTVAPGAVVLGGAVLRTGAILGAGSVLRQERTVGANSYIGLASAVVGDIPSGVIAYGNPARPVRAFVVEQ
jgi:UDP-3-O-[3-hydroxymyristoyl] glucosamine N-acyltransferase